MDCTPVHMHQPHRLISLVHFWPSHFPQVFYPRKPFRVLSVTTIAPPPNLVASGRVCEGWWHIPQKGVWQAFRPLSGVLIPPGESVEEAQGVLTQSQHSASRLLSCPSQRRDVGGVEWAVQRLTEVFILRHEEWQPQLSQLQCGFRCLY